MKLKRYDIVHNDFTFDFVEKENGEVVKFDELEKHLREKGAQGIVLEIGSYVELESGEVRQIADMSVTLDDGSYAHPGKLKLLWPQFNFNP